MGFPIAVTVYLFVRFERKIERLERVIVNLANVINKMNK
ncbi:YvrJ family protein [Brevibacillus ruminantium]|uniref:YvrJ family protein n=1 Tax=Brevibacillus ruminantium TaxID=2950604 RepID=A0ABY4WPB9_9BACL|nr:YvrJ family protein [Brevibacillus ruminantium]USG68504.1 YvrJ family protein [Brevibacillus ruminantium]